MAHEQNFDSFRYIDSSSIITLIKDFCGKKRLTNDEKLLIENVKNDHSLISGFLSKQIISGLLGFKIQTISQTFDLPFNLASASCTVIVFVWRAYKNVVRIHCISVSSQLLMVFNAISTFKNSSSFLCKCD